MTEQETGGRPGVVFDIDGTLLDTNYLHVVAWSAAFRDHDVQVDMADIHRSIGMPSAALVQRLAGRERADLVEAHSGHFDRLRERYGVQPVRGAGDLLRRCSELGWTVVLATSARKADLDWMLPAIGADDVIAGTTTSEDVRHGKPDPDVMIEAAEAHGLGTDATVAIGDAVWDVESAGRAGYPCIGLTSGGIGRFELQHAGAVEVYDDPHSLVERMRASLLGVRAPRKRG
jgi:HAD superfamily hydrolase (TIGR01509 family)